MTSAAVQELGLAQQLMGCDSTCEIQRITVEKLSEMLENEVLLINHNVDFGLFSVMSCTHQVTGPAFVVSGANGAVAFVTKRPSLKVV